MKIIGEMMFDLSKMFILPCTLPSKKQQLYLSNEFFMGLQFDNILVMQSKIKYSKFATTKNKNKNSKIKCQMAAILPSSVWPYY